MEAFRVLVEKYQQMAFTIALKILENRQEAEDLAQESFLKCFQSLSKFRGDASFSSWLYRIVYHKSLDRLKELKRKGKTLDWERLPEESLADLYPEQMLDTRELNIQIRTLINRLPPEDSILITLFYYEELPLKELAVVMDLSESNAKVRLHRIRQKLHKILKTDPILLNHK